MTLLVPMRPEAFDAFRQSQIVGYAEEKVTAGQWASAGALERSQANFADLLPQGLATPDHRLFEIVAGEGGPAVGHLWVAFEAPGGIRGAYVYDIEIGPAFQRQGHARRALQALEALVGAMGLRRIGLHVSAHNVGARAMYDELGFAATGISMLKTLPRSDD